MDDNKQEHIGTHQNAQLSEPLATQIIRIQPTTAPSDLPARLPIIKIFIVGLFIGLAAVVIQYVLNWVTIGCSTGEGANCYLTSYVGNILLFGGAMVLGIVLLRFMKAPRALETTVFATGALYTLFQAAQLLTAPPYLSLIGASVIFAGVLCLFFWFFAICKLDPTVKLAVAVVIAAGFVWGGSNLESFISEKSYKQEQDKKLEQLGFQLYAPVTSTGRFKFENFSSNEFSEPPFVEMHFALNLKANIYKTPDYFNPPVNCGQATPLSTSLSKSGTNYNCPLAFTTPKGRKVYGYSQGYARRVGDKPKPESYFTQLDGTVLSIEWLPPTITDQEIITVIDAFEPVTLDQLKNLDKVGQQQKKDLTSSLEQYVKFDIYAPKYIPSGFKLKRYLLGNVRDNTNPEMLIVLQNNKVSTKQISVYEYNSRVTFSPPEDCGQTSAESEGQYSFAVHCQLIATTPHGIKIYGSGYSSSLAPVTEIYLLIGRTKVSLYPWDSDVAELVKFVDGLVITPLKDIKYEKI